MRGLALTSTRCAWICVGLAAFFVAGPARADARVVTLDGRDWDRAVRDLAERVDSEGATLSVCAREDDAAECAPCGRYELTLDAAGASAFELGACDEATGATLVQLTHRAALFSHESSIPTLRAISLTASLRPPTPSEPPPACAARVRAFARDLERGEFVVLAPDRFALRSERVDVAVAPVDDAFVLTATGPGEVAYEILDRDADVVVLRGTATLACGPERIAPPAEPALAAQIATTTTTPARGSGVHIHAHAPEHDVAQGLVASGYGLVGAGALTLFVEAILLVIDLGATTCGLGNLFNPMPHACPSSITIPAELSYTALGAIGIGGIVGSAGLALDAAHAGASDVAALRLGVRF